MHFLPFNRHLVVDLIEQEEKIDESIIVLPSDYEKPVSPYAKAILIEASRDSKFYDSLQTNDTILVERRMLHKIEIDDSSFYLILENYIFGRIDT
jgi:co-chaperonin GroES (HSP10)